MNKATTLLIALCCFSWYELAAQCATLFKPLEERIEESYTVVEGKVLKQEAFQGKHLIYTSNLIEVFKVFKGDPNIQQLELVTTGGQLGEYELKVFPSLNLQIGQTGIFLLKIYTGSEIDDEKDQILRPVADGYSLIAYDSELTTAKDGEEEYERFEDLYSRIRAKTGQFNEVKKLPKSSTQRSPLAPVISNFSPSSLNAGVGDILTIQGSGFGNTIGEVLFSKADDGGSLTAEGKKSLMVWSDTEITVPVPTAAGTGEFKVETNGGSSSVTSASSLTVNYSRLNSTHTGIVYETKLIDEEGTSDAGDGGYYFNYSTSTANNGIDITAVTDATDALERAASTWQTESGAAFYLGTACTTVSTQIPNASTDFDDGINLITFDSDHNGGMGWDLTTQHNSSVLAVTYSLYYLCPEAVGAGHRPELVDVDIVFRRDGTGVEWAFGPAAPGVGEHDFETIALHELGHVIQLGHVINPGSLMHWTTASEAMIRTLGLFDDFGGDYVMSESTTYNPPINISCIGEDSQEARQIISYTAAHACSALLPVELIDFSGKKVEDAVQLYWQTATETNNDFFTLERSADGRNFEAITTVQGAGTTSIASNYSYLDKTPNAGVNYYRLWQTDFDGQRENLGTITLNVDFTDKIHLFPNPVDGEVINLSYEAPEDRSVELMLRDIAGRMLWTTSRAMSEGVNLVPITLPDLLAGVYILQIRESNNLRQLRFIVQ